MTKSNDKEATTNTTIHSAKGLFPASRTIAQIKKVYPIPYKYKLPNLSKYLT